MLAHMRQDDLEEPNVVHLGFAELMIWWGCLLVWCMHPYPYAPCMEYLPTFGWFLGQM